MSPLLSNILLDDLDKELERRRHTFCRYADDCNVDVRTWRAGERVMASPQRFPSERLRLTVNRAKSAVDRPWRRAFLGYGMTAHRDPRLKVADTSVVRLRDKLRTAFRQGRGRSIDRTVKDLAPILRGWAAYFRLSQVKGTFEDLDGWLRRKMRSILWPRWKKPRTRRQPDATGIERGPGLDVRQQRTRPLVKRRGQPHERCLPDPCFDRCGLLSVLDLDRRLNNAA